MLGVSKSWTVPRLALRERQRLQLLGEYSLGRQILGQELALAKDRAYL
jgi:hypothetical protein